MASSTSLRPFIFLDLPLELRLKIYREVFAGSEIKLTLTRKRSRTAITKWASPKYVKFLRSSSQIYEESFPILASLSRLKLWLPTEDSPEAEAANFKLNLKHLLSSPATGLFLRSTLPLVQAMDLETCSQLMDVRLEGLEALPLLKEIHSSPAYLMPTYKTRRITDWRLDDVDEQFFQDPAWESKIITAFKVCLDHECPTWKDIITVAAGSIRIFQSLQLYIFLLDSSTLLEVDVDVVENRVIRKRFQTIMARSGKMEAFDTSEAFLKYLHKARDEVQAVAGSV